MKKLFIYYSLSGNGDVVANYLHEKGIDIRKVIPEKPLPNNMLLRIMTGGFLAGIRHRDKLVSFDENISMYDEIIIGSPIWNGRLSCPINSVLYKLMPINKKITFILYSGSGEAQKTSEKLKTVFNATVINIKEPKQNSELLENLLKNI